MSMPTKIALSFLTVVVLAIAFVGVRYYQPDLSKDQLQEYINSDSQFADLPMGARVHYRDQGKEDGPALVLIHGGGGYLHIWELWRPYLERDFRLISMDLPGHGLTGRTQKDIYTRDSMVQAMHELLGLLQVEKIALAGHSMGGAIVLEYALKYPDEVIGLILLGPEGVVGPDGYDQDNVYSSEEDRAREEVLESIGLSWSERLATKFSFTNPSTSIETLRYLVYDDSKITPELVEERYKIKRHEGNRYSFALMMRQMLATIDLKEDLEPRLGEIEAPALIMIGRQDLLVTPIVGEKFHAGLPDSQLIIYENVGHMFQWEEAEKTALDAHSFLSETLINDRQPE